MAKRVALAVKVTVMVRGGVRDKIIVRMRVKAYWFEYSVITAHLSSVPRTTMSVYLSYSGFSSLRSR